VQARIAYQDQDLVLGDPTEGHFQAKVSADQTAKTVHRSLTDLFKEEFDGEGEWVSYYDLCLARSGDKGDTVNIGVIARSEGAFAFLKQHLTAQRVKDLFQEFCLGQVTRYTLEGLLGLNFLLEKSLGGGGSRSLRADSQGKTFSQALLRQKVRVPNDVLKDVSKDFL
jgi:hypothetical protein